MNSTPALVKQGREISFLISADYKDNQTHTKSTRTVHDKDKWHNIKSQIWKYAEN